MSYLVVFLGAGLGGIVRHMINRVTLAFGASFPVGTLAINTIGSFLMGLAAGWFATRGGNRQVLLFLTTGVLGGFTTYSAFALETAMLWERQDVGMTLCYVAGTLVLGLIGIFGGLALGRSLA